MVKFTVMNDPTSTPLGDKRGFDAIFDFALVTGTGGGGIFGDDIV